jgi:hypothetical protein
MITGKGKIRLALMVVAFVSLGASFLSLSYMNRMAGRIQDIVGRDARMVQLGEMFSRKMLEARREEKNFIIYLDTLYIQKNRSIIQDIVQEVEWAKANTRGYAVELDSLDILLGRYVHLVDLLVGAYQEDPNVLFRMRRQINSYEEALANLAKRQNLDPEVLRAWRSEMTLDLLSETTKLTVEKSRLFIDLKDISSAFISLGERITVAARAAMREDGAQGIHYSVKAQRNTLTLLFVATLFLAYMVVALPRRIFLPFRRIIRSLNAIARGESETPLTNGDTGDEFGELSRSFQNAIHQLKVFNALKAEKIVEIDRNFRKVAEEMNEALLVLTPDLTVSLANKAARRLFSEKKDPTGAFLKDLPFAWEVLGDALEKVEKKRRIEFSVKLKKRDLKKRLVTLISTTDKSGKLENILVILR